MSRYAEVSQDALDLMNEIMEERFPELNNCHIKVLMDSKKRKKSGRYTFADIKKTNEKEKYLSGDKFVSEGYDYIMIIDGNIYENVTREDKVRIVRHELRHIEYDPESNNPYKSQDHDIQDFREEIKLNQDDPDWDLRVLEIAKSIYEED